MLAGWRKHTCVQKTYHHHRLHVWYTMLEMCCISQWSLFHHMLQCCMAVKLTEQITNQMWTGREDQSCEVLKHTLYPHMYINCSNISHIKTIILCGLQGGPLRLLSGCARWLQQLANKKQHSDCTSLSHSNLHLWWWPQSFSDDELQNKQHTNMESLLMENFCNSTVCVTVKYMHAS